MHEPRFTFVTAVGTAGLSETAAKQMRSHVTKSNFAKRRERLSRTRKEEPNDSSLQLSSELRIVTTRGRPGPSQIPFHQPQTDLCARFLSSKWSLLFLDGSKYPATASEAAWIRLLISEPALVESSMAFALRHWSTIKDSQRIADDITSQAMENIIQRIRTGQGATDAVLAAALTMAFGERLLHNNRAWSIHIDGAVQVVNVRISRGLPTLSPWLEDILTSDIINDVFGFPRFYHKKFINATRTSPEVRWSSLIRLADLCENLVRWMQGIEASRDHPQTSSFLMEHVMRPMHDILSEARDIRADGKPAVIASCIAIELIVCLSWTPLPGASINLTAVANELKDAIYASSFRPCYYFDLTSYQLMIGAVAADEGSLTRTWFTNKMGNAWRSVKSRGYNDIMGLMQRNLVSTTSLKTQLKSLWRELDCQSLSQAD
ncbi:hypothetical protein F4777DRAFT_581549 [Nemania sp. FL0916]|nr:hypothetical protein F4777DRAFT_581549 [Nemania sp. FL0916]